MNRNKTIVNISERMSINMFFYYLSKFFLTKPFISPYVYSDYTKKDKFAHFYKGYSIIKSIIFKVFYIAFLIYICSSIHSAILLFSFSDSVWLNLSQENFLFSVWITFLYLGNYESRAMQFSKDKKILLLSFKVPFLEVYQSSLRKEFIHRIIYALVVLCVFLFLTKNIILALSTPVFIVFFFYFAEMDTLSYYHTHKEPRNTFSKTVLVISMALLMLLIGILNFNFYFKIILSFLLMSIYVLRKQKSYHALKTAEFINTIMVQNIRNADELIASASNQSLTHVEVDKKIDYESSQAYLQKSNGYTYFNRIFMNRHRRIWLKPLKILTILIFSFASILTGLLLYTKYFDLNALHLFGSDDVFTSVYFIFTKAFLLFYYFTNIGEKITQAYYLNADYSLLHYSFYRRKEVIWKQYVSRIKSSILIGVVPVITLVFFLILWKVMYPYSSNIQLFSFIINVFIISIFFNIHYLFMYYLLSPFNRKLETKSIPYNISKILIYVFVFNSSEFLSQSNSFIYMSIFFVLYMSLSILFVRMFAHKTFFYKD